MKSHTFEIARGLATSVLLRSLGAILQFVMTVVISRGLGASDAGVFFLGFTIVNVLSVGVRFGTDNYLVKKVSENNAIGSIGACWSYIDKVSLGVLFASLAMAIFLWLLAPLLSMRIFGKPDLQFLLRSISLMIVLLSYGLVLSFALQGFKKIFDSVLVQNVLPPLIITISGWLLIPIYHMNGTVLALGFGMGASAWYAWWRLRSLRNVVPSIGSCPSVAWRDIWNECKSFYLMQLMNQVVAWTPLLIMGIVLASDQLGIFQAAYRTALLVSFILVASNSIMAPKLVELNVNRQSALMRDTCRKFTFLLGIVAIPVVTVLVIFSSDIITIFGPEFSGGHFALQVLVVGQFINVLAGPAMLLLMMTGHATASGRLMLKSAIIGLVLSTILVPTYGLNGAAFASALTLAMQSVLAAIEVKRRLGFFPTATPVSLRYLIRRIRSFLSP